VKTGAFDFSGASRKQLLEGIDAALAAAAAQARDRAAGQHSFLDMLADEPRGNGAGAPPSRTSARSSSTVSISADADFHPAERLAFEKELLGFYVTGHPMNNYAGLAEAIDTYPVADLLSQGDRVEFRLCGIASNLAKRLSKKDNRPWVSFTLATKNASVPLNMFADAFANYSCRTRSPSGGARSACGSHWARWAVMSSASWRGRRCFPRRSARRRGSGSRSSAAGSWRARSTR
jgi:DNA polymerase-3 subunit alpha